MKVTNLFISYYIELFCFRVFVGMLMYTSQNETEKVIIKQQRAKVKLDSTFYSVLVGNAVDEQYRPYHSQFSTVMPRQTYRFYKNL